MIAFARIVAFFYLCLFACAIFAQSVTPRTSSLFEGASRVNQIAYADQQACATAATALLNERLVAKQYHSRMKLRCEASSLIEIAVPTPDPGQGAVWRKVADEVASPAFTVPTLSRVRYGFGTAWTELVVIGAGTCSNAFFGADPLRGKMKVCEVLTAVTPVVEAPVSPGLGRLPANPIVNVGSREFRVNTQSGENPPNSGDGTGNFRTRCAPSHYAFDDSIVYPGQPGRSHLHLFFGNTSTDAFTTGSNIRAKGASTCRGGTANLSAYWIPAMIDTKTNMPINPDESDIYYKQNYDGVKSSDIRPIPTGLIMLAGDASNRTPAEYGSPYVWLCHNMPYPSNRSQSIPPRCPAGDQLELSITFPQCHDGRNLNSPDSRSHMAYPKDGKGCPASHPVALPAVSFHILWPVPANGDMSSWRLSSDTYTGPAGYSAHADFIAGWDRAVLERWTAGCVMSGKDCGSHMLGGGWSIY